MVTPKATGYLIDHPLAVAARQNPRNWSMSLLVPTSVPVPDDFDTDCGPVIDQNEPNPYPPDCNGACVAFAASGVRSYQEKLDEGGWRFDTNSAFLAYNWLKHGSPDGSFTGDGIPTTCGSYPQAVWDLALKYGIPGTDGKPRRISAYYQLMGSPGDESWLDTQVQVLLQHGPITVSSGWPNNWWTAKSTGLLPYPSGTVTAHMYVRKGFWLKGPVGLLSDGLSPSGRYWRQRNSWGAYGATDRFGWSGEFLTPFELDGEYLRIWEVWKTVDIIDAPTPPPIPVPGGPDVIPSVDKIARLLLIPAGTQFYTPNTNQPLVKLSGTASARVYSPFAISGEQYACIISTGGVQQEVRVNKSAVTVIAASLIT